MESFAARIFKTATRFLTNVRSRRMWQALLTHKAVENRMKYQLSPERHGSDKSSKIGAHIENFTCSVENYDLSKKISFDLLKEHTHA